MEKEVNEQKQEDKKQESKSTEAVGRKLYQRLKAKGKIRNK